jgi:hypothetical protein
MALLVLLSDRAPEAALPALADLRFDVKVDALAASALDHVRELEPAVLLVDADENPVRRGRSCRRSRRQTCRSGSWP